MKRKEDQTRRRLTSDEKEIVSTIPNKPWFSLQECCDLKGVKIKTLYNHKEYQPNKGLGCSICGRKMFKRMDVINWMFMTDEELLYGRR
ncbi:MAG: hypothetical protein K6G51_01480 [Sphaerochaetaceae bacterium]|nr:hypothetical protein [Sphaerochaetaceae bacterium]